MIKRMQRAGVSFTENVGAISRKRGVLEGKTFVFTGELESFSRREASKRVEELGGTCHGAVSKRIDFVVAGKSPGSKYQKALALKVKIINEEQFKKMIQRP